MRKIAITYYSMSGNIEYVAKNISEKIKADLIKIVPKKAYPDSGFRKFFWGGKGAVMGETPIKWSRAYFNIIASMLCDSHWICICYYI